MPKLTPKQMKAAVEEFKKKFTPGFYHGSPSPNIKAFDPNKGEKDLLTTPQATFVTKKPEFAHDYLSPQIDPEYNLLLQEYQTGSTIYPVSVNMGKHFDFDTPEGQSIARQFLKQKLIPEQGRKKAAGWLESAQDQLNNWKALEHPDFLKHLQNTGYDTFAITEGGVKNVGIFDPKNIRGKFAKFNPEDAESPDFMKAKGGAIKKTLEHARKLPFVHFSKSPSIAQLEPRMYGTGIKGQEAGRLADAPDIKPRSYFYVDKPDVRPEQGLGPHKYQGMAEDIYPLHDDPAGFSAIAKQKSLDPYLMSQGIQQVNEAQHLNELERLIKQAGYKGYANEDVGLLFYPTPVRKAE